MTTINGLDSARACFSEQARQVPAVTWIIAQGTTVVCALLVGYLHLSQEPARIGSAITSLQAKIAVTNLQTFAFLLVPLLLVVL